MGAFETIFGKSKTLKKIMSRWQEIGSFKSIFSPFGNDAYRSDLIRACIRPLADYSAKANFKSNDKSLERLWRLNPNIYMTGHDMLYKLRTMLELKNTAFLFLNRDDRGKVCEFYPVPYKSFEALEFNSKLFIKFSFISGKTFTSSWDDLVVLRKDYIFSDISGEDNSPILQSLELISVTNQGVANAIKSTANLRGILKTTKGMLAPEDIKKSRDEFVKDYMNLENEGGIASLDSTQEFTPITMNPTIANYTHLKEFRENIYRYFGVNDAILMGTATEDEREGFYQSRIEPFLIALSDELERKVFTAREIGFNNYIILESNKLQYASIGTKLNLVQMVDRGAMTPNEWRAVLNLAPIEGGDVPIRRLDTAEVTKEEINGE